MASAPPLPDLDFEAMSAEDMLRWAYSEFGDRMCLTCSWQRQSSVLVHMVSELGLEIPVVELDTLVLFPETYETRDRLVERYGLEAALRAGRSTRRTGCGRPIPTRCCGIRKVEAARGRAARATTPGSPASAAGSRPRARTRRRSSGRSATASGRCSRSSTGTRSACDAYILVNEIPVNPLHEQGYPSIGCVPCTRPVQPGEDERAGRWSGSSKLECGIHGDGRPGSEIRA